MKVFILFQKQYHEGNFGDIGRGTDLLHGVYTTRAKASKVAKTIEQPLFEARFGSGDEICFIKCVEVI